MESPGHDQYRVKVDGSGRLTLRNRRFLRAYTPATPSIQQQHSPLRTTEQQHYNLSPMMVPSHSKETTLTPPITAAPRSLPSRATADLLSLVTFYNYCCEDIFENLIPFEGFIRAHS
ncbi:hypothetical protein QZH41_019407 [Actinostola sp. cb2023]|nr:hypothetical protein QZH41_019407 [Actinostola sp. cb2023]